jgi:ubiquinone/menaquinone biosynthesis C-methylase UbiE
MGFYDQHVLPRLIHFAMKMKRLEPYRARVAGAAEGRVLEVGMGSGLNLPFYSDRVTEIIGLEPHPKLREMAGLRGTVITGSAEEIPLESASVDTLVTTWTLCSIPHVDKALKEMRRVLKPGGRLLFVEHGLAPDADVRQSQQKWSPLWGKFTGGCHLDRPMDALIREAGFAIEDLHTGYIEGPKMMTFTYQGSARPR